MIPEATALSLLEIAARGDACPLRTRKTPSRGRRGLWFEQAKEPLRILAALRVGENDGIAALGVGGDGGWIGKVGAGLDHHGANRLAHEVQVKATAVPL